MARVICTSTGLVLKLLVTRALVAVSYQPYSVMYTPLVLVAAVTYCSSISATGVNLVVVSTLVIRIASACAFTGHSDTAPRQRHRHSRTVKSRLPTACIRSLLSDIPRAFFFDYVNYIPPPPRGQALLREIVCSVFSLPADLSFDGPPQG